MRRVTITWVAAGALLAACGSVQDRPKCSGTSGCAAGQYCAATADGNVCWADTVAPTIGGVSVACLPPYVVAAGCRRDGVLRLSATITDDHEVASAEVRFDVGGPTVPLVRSGDAWTADVRLATLPFDHFEHAVVATVTARDTAGNVAALEPAGATTVTRRRFDRILDTVVVGPGHPAVMQDGTVAIAGTNGKVYFVPWDGEGLVSVSVGVSPSPIVAAPLAAGGAIWLGREDGGVYKLTTTPTGWGAQRVANAGSAISGSLAVTSGGLVIAAANNPDGAGGVVYAITELNVRNAPPAGLPIGVGPVVDEFDGIYAVAIGSVLRYSLTGGFPTEDWDVPASLGGTLSEPLACSSVLVATANTLSVGIVGSVTRSGDPQHIATTAFSSGGPTVLSDSTILVPEQTKTVSRWTSTGDAFPGWQKPDLGGAARTPLVLTAATPFIVPTSKGAVHALRTDGSIAWSAQLSAGTASLQPGNLFTPPGQAAGEELSVAYFAGADGVLHAIIVDGQLDRAAPWPKVFHDPRNTNRAGAQP